MCSGISLMRLGQYQSGHELLNNFFCFNHRYLSPVYMLLQPDHPLLLNLYFTNLDNRR
jgi:hypothetical protein